ncbi:unnamed protein product [Soboliphyme baturini]|uniref:Uncharacterized protein n=1 Tax=Soboliphyme baturini TaxID=241478 RepID=A0A183IFF0_9BILA|nr:unnamed protein product [Soboliphyme baturini]
MAHTLPRTVGIGDRGDILLADYSVLIAHRFHFWRALFLGGLSSTGSTAEVPASILVLYCCIADSVSFNSHVECLTFSRCSHRSLRLSREDVVLDHRDSVHFAAAAVSPAAKINTSPDFPVPLASTV